MKPLPALSVTLEYTILLYYKGWLAGNFAFLKMSDLFNPTCEGDVLLHDSLAHSRALYISRPSASQVFFYSHIQFVCAKFCPQNFLAFPGNLGISSPLLFVSSPDPILAMCHCEDPLGYLVRKVTVENNSRRQKKKRLWPSARVDLIQEELFSRMTRRSPKSFIYLAAPRSISVGEICFLLRE